MKRICQRVSGCWTFSELKKELYKLRERVVSCRLELSPKEESIGEGPCSVLQRPQGGERGRVQNPLLSMDKFKQASLFEAPWLRNTLLKEKVLQEKVGLSSLKLFPAFVQSSVRLSLRPLSIQTDERVGCPDSCLTARRSLGN